MFNQWFEQDKWQVLYYDSLQNNERSLKNGTKKLTEIVGITLKQPSNKKELAKQLDLI